MKDAKRKVLPELTDEWVSENTESETVDALRDESRRRIDLFGKLQAQMAHARPGARRARRASSPVEAPEALVDQEHGAPPPRPRAPARGARASSIPQWLAATGQDQADVRRRRSAAGPTKAVLADLALRAVVAQEEIEATDEELDTEIDRLAERTGEKPQKVRRDLDRRGLLEAVRSDIARGKALQFVVDAAVALDSNGDRDRRRSIPTPDATAATPNPSPPKPPTPTPAEESEA